MKRHRGLLRTKPRLFQRRDAKERLCGVGKPARHPCDVRNRQQLHIFHSGPRPGVRGGTDGKPPQLKEVAVPSLLLGTRSLWAGLSWRSPEPMTWKEIPGPAPAAHLEHYGSQAPRTGGLPPADPKAGAGKMTTALGRRPLDDVVPPVGSDSVPVSAPPGTA